MEQRKDKHLSILNSALEYAERFGFSVIPIRPDKKPYFKWEEFQTHRATQEEIIGWWKRWPVAMIGIITGSISGVVVIDIDTPEGEEAIQEYISDSLSKPACRTPRGGKHLYFKHPGEPTPNARIVPGCDFRGDGGYVVAPPSVNGDGRAYEWLEGLSIKEVVPPPLPDAYKKLFYSLEFGGYKGGVITPVTTGDIPLQNVTFVEEGIRDNVIFHLANFLARGGCPEKEAFQYLEFFAKSCNPPFPLNEMREKVKSAMKRDWARQQNLAQWVREWIGVTTAYFSVTELYNSLQSVTSDVKANIRQIVHRLCNEKPPILERHPNKNGFYRRIETDCEEIDFLHAPDEPLDIRYPFGIERYFNTYPKNIGVIAGSKDSGKTAFLLNFGRLNMERFPVHYFSSEMGNVELKKRLQQFDLPLEAWKINPKERSKNFADVIRADGINIIDYLEVNEDFYRVGGMLREIYEKLNQGIALVALQKNRGRETGVGGDRSLEKPRLYLSLEKGKAKIVVAKNWTGEVNPVGLELNFKLVQGWKFLPEGGWH